MDPEDANVETLDDKIQAFREESLPRGLSPEPMVTVFLKWSETIGAPVNGRK